MGIHAVLGARVTCVQILWLCLCPTLSGAGRQELSYSVMCRVYKAIRGGCDIVAVKIMKGQHDPRSADLFAREVNPASKVHLAMLQHVHA